MPKNEVQDEGSAEKFANMIKKRRAVFFEIFEETGLGDFAAETIKMFDKEGVVIGKLTYELKGDIILINHLNIDLWEDGQAFPERFIKWFEGYAKKKKAKDLRVELLERDSKTYDLVQIFRSAGFSPTATGFMRGRTSYELHKKL
jgi:hypothetical protein